MVYGCFPSIKLRTAKHTVRFDLFKRMLLLWKLFLIEATQTQYSRPVVVNAQNDH